MNDLTNELSKARREHAADLAKRVAKLSHTPGPWRVERSRLSVAVKAGNYCVALTADSRTGVTDGSIAIPNAYLIAAAPELLKALADMVDVVENTKGSFSLFPLGSPELLAARSALAKATGGAA